MNWFTTVYFKKYAKFSGRAQRKEFWIFNVFYILLFIVSIIILKQSVFSSGFIGCTLLPLVAILCDLIFMVGLVPAIAVGVRRLHDIGYSGWMILISVIPIVGTFWLVVLMLRDSEPDENKYGPNPKLALSNKSEGEIN